MSTGHSVTVSKTGGRGGNPPPVCAAASLPVACGNLAPARLLTFECGHPRTKENTVTLRGKWEYCRICNRQAANRRYRARHPGARQKAFLSLDDRLACHLRKTPHHTLWLGEMRDGSIAICHHDKQTHFVAQLLWEREHGPVPERHCLYRTCSVARCVRPRCRSLELRASHITKETRGVRGRRRTGPKRIYGMSPELAAFIGIIDDEQYLSCFKPRRGAKREASRHG